jgi:hypothetical protein
MPSCHVQSGLDHGPIEVERVTASAVISLTQHDATTKQNDVIVFAQEHAASLADSITRLADPVRSVDPAPTESVPPPLSELDYHFAVPTGTDSGAIELGLHHHRDRYVALLRQPDGADEDGELIFNTLAIDAAKLDHLIDTLHALKGLLA